MALKNTVKTLRIPDDLVERIKRLVHSSKMEEAEIYRQALLAGIERIEGGNFNPFGGIKKPKK